MFASLLFVFKIVETLSALDRLRVLHLCDETS